MPQVQSQVDINPIISSYTHCGIAPEGVVSRWGFTYHVRFCASCAVMVSLKLLQACQACTGGGGGLPLTDTNPPPPLPPTHTS